MCPGGKCDDQVLFEFLSGSKPNEQLLLGFWGAE